jgi:hypothetical protein
MTIKETKLYLECLLINDVDPIFLQIDYQQEFIYIFVVADYFKHYSISERIEAIFMLLKFDCPSILSEYPVAVECFSEEEFTELLKMERNARKQITPRKN